MSMLGLSQVMVVKGNPCVETFENWSNVSNIASATHHQSERLRSVSQTFVKHGWWELIYMSQKFTSGLMNTVLITGTNLGNNLIYRSNFTSRTHVYIKHMCDILTWRLSWIHHVYNGMIMVLTVLVSRYHIKRTILHEQSLPDLCHQKSDLRNELRIQNTKYDSSSTGHRDLMVGFT